MTGKQAGMLKVTSALTTDTECWSPVCAQLLRCQIDMFYFHLFLGYAVSF